MATTDIGIDLGTANTVITLGRKGVVLRATVRHCLSSTDKGSLGSWDGSL